MPKYLVLPKIGMNMEEGVITEWLIKPGDHVKKEQMVIRAETDKAIQDMFATESGIVYKLLVNPGDVVPCQGKIAMLLDEGEEAPLDDETRKETDSLSENADTASKIEEHHAAISKVVKAEKCKIRISPLAKKIAKEFNIPVDSIKPAIEGERIVKADVLRVKEDLTNKKTDNEVTESEEFVAYGNKRKVIAKRMKESVANKPRVCHVLTVDCEELFNWREQIKKTRKVSYNELIMKACATALKKYPDLNVLSTEGGYVKKSTINIGIAVDNPQGLLVPVIKNIGNKGIFEISDDFKDLTTKAKEGKLTLDEMSGATFTISNLGMFEIESFDPIPNIPECLILGVGVMKEVPAVVDGEITIRKRMKLSLSFDHAVIDGAPAARLIQEIKHLLEAPAMMLL